MKGVFTMSENTIKLIPEAVNKAAENLTDLPTKNIGSTLADCWFLVFGGITYLADKRRAKYSHNLEKFKTELQSSLDKVPNEKKKEPTTQVVMSALNDARYCVEEDELRKLFVNLITSATDTSKTVHPSFSHIIKQMSSTDAIILKSFKSSPMQPLCHIKKLLDHNKGFNYLQQNLFLNGSDEIGEEQKTISISSLIYLGLLEIPDDLLFIDESAYEPFKQSHSYLDAVRILSEGKVELEHHVVKLTSLGKLFVSCCITD